jgi:hypothetical protein
MAAARGEQRAQHERHGVADAAGRMFVDDGTVDAGVVPPQHAAAVAHGEGQRDRLAGRHAAPAGGHREGRDLRVADAAVDHAGDEGADLAGGERGAVAFATQRFLRQRHQ